MLKELRIHNLVLIEYAEIPFDKGLNVITGETGSGKSAILGALHLILGGRADTAVIRKGVKKGAVEAEFDVASTKEMEQFLSDSGINHETDTPLIIRREISSNGKSRVFINNQMAQVNTLRTVGTFLSEMVGQHASRKLLNTEFHRTILDAFGGHHEICQEFAKGWDKEKKLQVELDLLRNSEAERLREIEACYREINEIEEAQLKEGEEEELFSEYTLLTNAGELIDKTTEALDALSCMEALTHTQSLLEDLCRFDSTLDETVKTYKGARLELSEVVYTLEQYRSRIDHNPSKANMINDRLGVINQIKKKYGSSVAEITEYHTTRQKRLEELEDADNRIEDVEAALQQVTKHNDAIAETLTEKRQEAAILFRDAIILQLRGLNMPKVDFSVDITKQVRNRHGNDKIEFFLIPNVGEKRIPITDCASGGELSRLVLSIHTLLAGRNKVATLIFDEVDANIGGETAAKVGHKLKEIAKQHQVLCVTHFPQVADHANYHIQISKEEQDGRTVTRVKRLDRSERHQELERMLGGERSRVSVNRAEVEF